nr:hypothetical protein [Tanacetum cinerariifolium]
MNSQIISLNEELPDIRNKYNEIREGNASKNHLNYDTPMCERHEASYIQYEGYQSRDSHDSYSHQSHHDHNDSEKSLTELNNDVRNDFEDIKRYNNATVDSCETAQEIWRRVQQMMKGSDIGIQEKKAKLFNDGKEWSRHVTIVDQTKDLHTANYTQLYDFLKYNQKENYLQQLMPNPEDITDPTTAMNMALTLMAKAFKLNYSIPTNNNKRISLNPKNRQIAQPDMNMGQDRQMQMVGGNNENQFRQYAGQNAGNSVGYNDVIGNQHVLREMQSGKMETKQGVTTAGRIQLQAEEYDLMAAAADLDKIEEVNTNCISMANLQQASTSGTQTDSVPVYDTDRSAEYDNDVISEDTSVEQGGETVEQHPVNFEETRALYESLYLNLAIEVEKVNSVNRTLKETNADLTTELARYKNQERCFEISQEKYDKLERCYQPSIYQEQCLSKKINALHLITDLNKQLLREKSTVSSLLEEKKKMKYDFKTRKDELLDKQIQLEKWIKELNNILVKTDDTTPSVTRKFLNETLQLAQESRDKMKQMNKEIKPANYTKINHLSRVFVPQTALSREELYFSNNSKTANVSKSFSIPNEDLLDDITPSVARKFLNEVKRIIVTLQRVVKQRMTIETYNWASSAHQELHKFVRDEIFPIVNQVDARLQNFKIQFLKEAAKFVGDFKSLKNEADASLAKHKALELEIKHLLKAVVSQDIMIIVQNESVVDTSDLQTELERMKERFENCIIKKENEYAKLWNDWYKKWDECKYDKISYDKAYKDMQQKIERL